ncbi:MAG: hypothetical protein B7Z72_05565, partial [Gemmatimonadetes bacterium 21-71-4]
EFADLCPDQDDIRLMLADQLQKVGKATEAVQQLQLLYQRYMAEDRKSEADATAERIRSIDPDAEVRAGDTPLETKAQDLVFLDLNEAPRPARMSTQMAPPAAPPPPPASRAIPPVAPSVVEPTHVSGAVSAHEVEAPSLDGVTRATDLAAGTDTDTAHNAAPLAGLEATAFDARATGAFPASLIDLEPTSLSEQEPAAQAEVTVDAESEGAELELILPDEATPRAPIPTSTPSVSATPASGSPTAGLPLMDFEEAGRPSGEQPAAGEIEATPSDAMVVGRISNVGRASTLLAAQSVEMLHAVVEGAPEDWDAHRELGEAMLEAGDRESGLQAFETAMRGYERDGNLEAAASMADEIVRADPGSVKHYQKRVEYAFRSNDKRRLVDAYLELADALFRGDQGDKARVIYRRVLDLSPHDPRAQAALSALPEVPAAEAAPGPGAPTAERKSRPVETPRDGGSFVNLGDLMREEEPPKDTRMVVAEEEPTGDEEADFTDMLRRFKQGVAENVEEEDYQSHYDLGIAYKEMGLLDEAISEFQKALRAADNRVRTYESIGQCFMEKAQYHMAATLLGRALHEKGMSDDQLIGVLYLLGRACEELGKPADALMYYQRIFVVDIQFRDVGDRMNALEKAGT